jgi:hypothetical protein
LFIDAGVPLALTSSIFEIVVKDDENYSYMGSMVLKEFFKCDKGMRSCVSALSMLLRGNEIKVSVSGAKFVSHSLMSIEHSKG